MQNRVTKILVMDDNANLRKLYKKLLEKINFEVELTKDGEEAIKVYKEEMEKGNPFDLILVDLNIDKGIGGIEAVRTIREFDPNIKAIVVSGQLPSEITQHPAKYGFDSFLEKPFKLESLKNIIEKVFA